MRLVTELLEQNAARVYRFALQLTGDPDRSRDLVQETMLRAWRARDQLRDVTAIGVWLLRITNNVWRDWQRRQRSPIHRAARLENEAEAAEGGPLQAVVDQENVKRVMEALEQLPNRQREILYLHACEGLSPSDIAEILQLAANSVRVTLCEARKRMRQQLADLDPGKWLPSRSGVTAREFCDGD